MKLRAPKLLIGVGNILKRDDGAGIYAIERASRMPLPSDVECYDAGTLGFEAAAVIERRACVVVVDAVDAGAEAGAIFRFTPETLRPSVSEGFSLHEYHLLDAWNETQLLGTAPGQITVIAVQPGDISTGMGLTEEVERSLDRVLAAALAELGVSVGNIEHTAGALSP